MKGIYLSESHLTPDQAFVLRKFSHRISKLRYEFMVTRILFFVLLIPVSMHTAFTFLRFHIPFAAQLMFLLVMLFILLNPFFTKGSGSGMGGLRSLFKFVSSTYYHRQLYAELLNERASLEQSGLHLEEWDWKRRIHQAFIESQFGTHASLSDLEAQSPDHRPAPIT